MMAALGSGRRWKRIVTVSIIGLAIAGVAGFFLLKNVEANQAATLRREWGSLEGCTLGDGLKSGETPSARARAIQLTVVGTPREQRAPVGQLGWPANCAPAASLLAEHADSAEKGGSELKKSAEDLARAMRENATGTSDIGKLVEAAGD